MRTLADRGATPRTALPSQVAPATRIACDDLTMHDLEILIGLVLVATLLAAVARRVGAPYPAFLALGGATLAFVPGAPAFTVLPELALALFVAPILLDAAYDASPRDLRDNWVPLTGLVVCAVGLTTMAVAIVAR